MSGRAMPHPEVEAMAAWILERAVSAGAKDADVIYSFSEARTLDLRDGSPEESSSGLVANIGVRVIDADGRQGVASSNRFDRSSLSDLVSWSLDNCKNSEPEEGISLHRGRLGTADGLEQFDESLREISPEKRNLCCEEMTKIARNSDPRVVSVRSASWSDSWGELLYASSAGLSGWKRGTVVSCGVAVVLQEGERFDMGGYGNSARFVADIDPLSYARKATERTAKVLGGKPLPTGRYTLILTPEITAALIGEIGDLFCAPEIQRGRSLMKGRLGSKVAGSALTLVDDGRLARRIGSSPFDGEGVATGRTVLIDQGKANSYLYNIQYAAKDGVQTTGNATRGASGLPDVGTSNLVLSPGDTAPESIVKGISKGLLVFELMGLHTIDPVSGDFSLGAKGVNMKNGVENGPVTGVTIAGNLLDLLEKAAAVADDLMFFGDTAAPTLIVEDMALAGD